MHIARRVAEHWRLIVLLALTAGVFGHVARFPFSIVDDPSNVVHNPLVEHPLAQGISGLLRTPAMGYPHTVTVLSLAIDRTLFGVDPAGYHVVNLLVHLVDVTLLYALMLELGASIGVASAAVAVFALHPLVAEPVSWVIARKDLLSTGFLVAAFLVIAQKRDTREDVIEQWIVADALCVLAIFSKPSAIMAPALLWLVIRCAHPSWRWQTIVTGLAPVAAAAAAAVLVGVPELHDQGAVVVRSRPEILVDVVRAWTLQIRHLVWPVGLLAEYERSAAGDPPAWLIVAVVTLTLAVAVYAWRRLPPRSVGRMALGFVPVSYLPAAGFLPTWHWTADSYFYLPLVGVTIAIATVLPRVWPRLTGFFVLVPVLAVLAYVQSFTWSSSVATFRPVAEHYVDDPRPLNRLAFAHLYGGDADAAAALFITLDRRFPDFEFNRAQRAWAYYRRGDRANGDAVLARCAAANDVDCVRLARIDQTRGSAQATPR